MPDQAQPMLPLAQSDSKLRFMQRLDLDINIEDDRRISAMMKAEAGRSREAIMHDRDALVMQLRLDQTIQPPFSSSQISETAMHREVINIYENASPETRPFYERAHDLSGVEAENWIIRWMLWHVFRYRDSRNKPKSMRSVADTNRNSTGAPQVQVYSTMRSPDMSPGTSSSSAQPLSYGYMRADLSPRSMDPTETAQVNPFMRRLPFDPARDV